MLRRGGNCSGTRDRPREPMAEKLNEEMPEWDFSHDGSVDVEAEKGKGRIAVDLVILPEATFRVMVGGNATWFGETFFGGETILHSKPYPADEMPHYEGDTPTEDSPSEDEMEEFAEEFARGLKREVRRVLKQVSL